MTSRTFTMYDWHDRTEHKITVIHREDDYRIKVDGNRWCDHENMELVEAELQLMAAMYCWHWMPNEI